MPVPAPITGSSSSHDICKKVYLGNVYEEIGNIDSRAFRSSATDVDNQYNTQQNIAGIELQISKLNCKRNLNDIAYKKNAFLAFMVLIQLLDRLANLTTDTKEKKALYAKCAALSAVFCRKSIPAGIVADQATQKNLIPLLRLLINKGYKEPENKVREEIEFIYKQALSYLGSDNEMIKSGENWFAKRSGASKTAPKLKRYTYDYTVGYRTRWMEILAQKPAQAHLLLTKDPAQYKQVLLDYLVYLKRVATPSPTIAQRLNELYTRMVSAIINAYTNTTSTTYAAKKKEILAILGKDIKNRTAEEKTTLLHIFNPGLIGGFKLKYIEDQDGLTQYDAKVNRGWVLAKSRSEEDLNLAVKLAIENLNTGHIERKTHDFIKILIEALNNLILIKGKTSPKSLELRQILALVLKLSANSIPNLPAWVTMLANVAKKNGSNNYYIMVAQTRLDLNRIPAYFSDLDPDRKPDEIVKQGLWIAGLLSSIADTLKKAGREKDIYDPFFFAAVREYLNCQIPLIREIQKYPQKASLYLSLASAYHAMGDQHEKDGDKETARLCWKRAKAICQALWDGIQISSSLFTAQGDILPDISALMRGIIIHRNALLKSLKNGNSSSSAPGKVPGKIIYEFFHSFAEAIRKVDLVYDREKSKKKNLKFIDTSFQTAKGFYSLAKKSIDPDVISRANAGEKEAFRARIRAYILAGKFEEAIKLYPPEIIKTFTHLSAGGTPSFENLTLALGNITELAWAYAEKGQYDSRYLGKEHQKTSYVNFLKSAAIYHALLYGKQLLPKINDQSFKEIIKLIIKFKAHFDNPLLLLTLKISKEELYMRLGDLTRDAAQKTLAFNMANKLYVFAGKQYQAALALLQTSNGNGLSKVKIAAAQTGLAKTYILRSELSLKLGQPKIAKKYLAFARHFAKKGLLALTHKDIDTRKEGKLILDAFSTYSWALGKSGGFAEKQGDISGAHKYFKLARTLNNAFVHNLKSQSLPKETKVLAQIASTLKEQLPFRQTLIHDQPQEYFSLDLAKLYKASSKGYKNPQEKIRALSRAIYIFETIISQSKDILFAYKIKEAQVELAEALTLRGKYYEDTRRDDLAEKDYQTALQICLASIKDQKPIKTLAQSTVYLKGISALIWALKHYMDLKKYTDVAYSDIGSLLPIALFNCLTTGNISLSPELRTFIIAKLNIAEAEINSLFGFLKTYAQTFAQNKARILEAADLTENNLKLGFIGLLISAKKYSDAANMYKDYVIPQLKELAKIPPAEFEIILEITSALGDIYCYKFEDFKKAKEYYLKTLEIFTSYKKKYTDLPEEIKLVEQKAILGLAKIDIENNNYKAAEKKYWKGINHSNFNQTSGSLPLKAQEVLIRAYLGLGGLYLHLKPNHTKALEMYKKARQLISLLSIKKAYRYLVQAFLESGDVYRLLNQPKQAINFYQDGLKLLTGQGINEEEDIELETLIRAALSQALAQEGKVDLALQENKKARELIQKLLSRPYGKKYQKTFRRIIGDTSNIWDEASRCPGSFRIGGAFSYNQSNRLSILGNAFQGQAGPSGEGFISYQISRRFSLALNYQPDIPQAFNIFNPGSSAGSPQNLARMESNYNHSIGLSLNYKLETPSYNLSLNPFIQSHIFSYRIYEHSFSQDYRFVDQLPGYPLEHPNTLLSFSLGGIISGDWKLKLPNQFLLLIGGQAKIAGSFVSGPGIGNESYLISQLENAKTKNPQATKEALPGPAYATASRLKNTHLFTWNLNPGVNLVFPAWVGPMGIWKNSSLRLGFSFGEDPIAATLNNFYPMRNLQKDASGKTWFKDLDSFRISGTISARTDITFGLDSRMRIPIEFLLEGGNYLYLQITTGFKYYGDMWNIFPFIRYEQFEGPTDRSQRFKIGVEFGF